MLKVEVEVEFHRLDHRQEGERYPHRWSQVKVEVRRCGKRGDRERSRRRKLEVEFHSGMGES